jgi:hypothetical protein
MLNEKMAQAGLCATLRDHCIDLGSNIITAPPLRVNGNGLLFYQLKNLHSDIQQRHFVKFTDEIFYGVGASIDEPLIIANHGQSDQRTLPKIHIVHFRDRHIEFIAQPLGNAFNHAALGF